MSNSVLIDAFPSFGLSGFLLLFLGFAIIVEVVLILMILMDVDIGK